MTVFWGTKQALAGPLGTWTYGDVFLSTLRRAEWTRFAEQLSLGLLAEEHLARGLIDLDPARVREVAEAYRRAERLLTVEETQRWLASQDLPERQWERYLLRCALRREWGEALGRESTDRSSEAEFGEAFFAEALCSDFLPHARDRFAEQLAMAALGPALEPRAMLEEVHDLNARHPWLRGVEDARLARVVAVLRSASRYLSRRCTRDQLAAVVASRRLDWTQLECGVLRIPDEGRAAEAFLCITRDERTDFARVARQLSSSVEHATFFVERAPVSARARFLGARAGEVIGPVHENGTFAIYRVSARWQPVLEDGRVEALARSVLERRVVAQAKAQLQGEDHQRAR